MPYLVRGSDFLRGHGYAVIIVAGPTSKGHIQTVECHSFFSRSAGTYEVFEHSYGEGATEALEDAFLVDTAVTMAEERLYSILREVSIIQHQAMLLGFGFQFQDKDKNYLLQLHLRDLLNSNIEQEVRSRTRDVELKSYFDMVSKLSRVTTIRRT
jgi:hypothetical protein